MNEPSPWKQPLIYGSALGVLSLANSMLPAAGAAVAPADAGSLVILASQLLGLVLFLVGAPVAGALAVRGSARERMDYSRFALTVGEGAGVGARTGLVTTAYLVLGVVLGMAAAATLGVSVSPTGIGAGEVANIVGAGFAAAACGAVCYGIFYAAFGAIGGAIGVPIFARDP